MEIDDDHLRRSHSRRQHQSLVIAMHHDQHTDRSRGESPAVLPHQSSLYTSIACTAITSRLRLVRDVEHLREVLAQTVRRRCLHGSSIRRNKRLHRCRIEASGKLLLLRLASLDHRHSEQLLVGASVIVEDLQHLLLCLLLRGEGAVALLRVRETVSTHLPEEFAGSDEGGGMLELPANDVRPLVETEREVAVSTDPSGVGLVRIGQNVYLDT